MKTLFVDSHRDAILSRLAALAADSVPKWGRMDVAQMLTHCARATEVATGDRQLKQRLLGKILGPFVRSAVLGDRPFKPNGPTDASFIVEDQRDFDTERARLRDVLERVSRAGADEAQTHVHVFFGRLTGDEWGRLIYKHLDHHLRQFGC